MELTDDQTNAVSAAHKNVCVIAGAGTGKTTVLVEKFISLVTGNQSVTTDEVLAITFTEKAAVEMKRKVLDRFSEMGREELKREAESAYISTIHGFCTRILRQNPLEAEVDPAFEVIDEVTSAAYMELALESFFEEPPPDLQELLQLYEEGFIVRAVTSAIRRYRSMGYSVKNFVSLPDSITRLEKIIAAKKGMLARLGTDIKQLADTLEKQNVTNKLEEKKLGVIGLAAGLDSSAPDVNIIREIRELCKNVRSKAPKDSDPETYRQVADTLIEIKNRCDARKWLLVEDEEAEKEAENHRRWLHLAAREVFKRYDGHKKELGALDFDDLQLQVKELFANHPHILEQYRSKFKAVLVDEYQDVNRLQSELIGQLTAGNNLFVVGDPKQLIYEFRDADPEQFRKFYYNLEDDGKGATRILKESFRSRQEILDFINQYFLKMWAGTDLPYHPIQSIEGLHSPKKVPSVEILVFPITEGESMDEAREVEAHGVAARIEKMIHIPANELAKWGREESCEYGDMAVLFRSSSAIKIYEKVFKTHGIPYNVIKGAGFFQSREFADALALLQVIDNDLQDIPMAAVLRSPFVGVKDDTLFQLKTKLEENENQPCFSEALQRLHEIKGLGNGEREKLESFTEMLSRLRAARGRATADELLDMALAESSYQIVILSDPDGLQKTANMKKVLQFVREHRFSGTEDLSSMCRFMETTIRIDVSEKEAPLEYEGGNAVNLITIHSAKGLEFPIVILADMGRDFSSGKKGQGIHVSEDYGICSKHRSNDENEIENAGYHLSSEMQKERQQAEEKRLLYVAMTRAREHLILAGSGKFNNETSVQTATIPMKSVLAELGLNPPHENDDQKARAEPQIINHDGYEVRIEWISKDRKPGAPPRLFTMKDRYENEIFSGLKIPDGRADEILEDSLARRLDYNEIPLPEKPVPLSVTGLLEYRQCPARYYFKYRLGLPEKENFLPSNRGKTSGPRFGSKVHAMLNLFDFEKEPEEQLSALSRAADVPPDYKDETLKMLKAFAGCSLFADLRSAKELYRELPFSMRLDGADLSGVMDVLLRKGEKSWFILDYKTDDVEGEKIAPRAEAYFFQLLLYSLALEQTLGFAPQKVMLYFLRPESVLEKEVGEANLRAAGEEAVELITGIRDEHFPLVKSTRCFSCSFGDTFCKILE